MDNKAFFKQFVKDRNEALFSFDKEKILKFMKKYHMDKVPEKDNVFWGGIAKAVMNIPNAPEDAKKHAQTLLDKLGWSNKIFEYLDDDED